MAALSVACVVLAVVDPRQLLGQNIWFKPLKFALSIAVYALSLAWMIGVTTRFSRTAGILGSVAVAALTAEIVIITGAAAIGRASHFQVGSPLASALWAVMGTSIVVVWLITLAVGLALTATRLGDRARDLAVRAGVLLAVVGMALAFLMTAPRSPQVDGAGDVLGAHAVGVPDGGPGLPFLGWSTEAGDLRVPHFVGMHALQVIPLAAWCVERLATRHRVLRDAVTRSRFVLVLAVGYAVALALVTAQALTGESVVRPSPVTLLAAASLAVSTLTCWAVLLTGRWPGRRRPAPDLTP